MIKAPPDKKMIKTETKISITIEESKGTTSTSITMTSDQKKQIDVL